ncbi:hypothetical protein KCU99_g319, partial [Aureobasidium melanogenum]
LSPPQQDRSRLVELTTRPRSTQASLHHAVLYLQCTVCCFARATHRHRALLARKGLKSPFLIHYALRRPTHICYSHLQVAPSTLFAIQHISAEPNIGSLAGFPIHLRSFVAPLNPNSVQKGHTSSHRTFSR